MAVLIVRRSDLWIYTTPFPTRPRGVLRRRKVQYAALDVPCDILEVAPASIALVEPQVTRRLRSFAKAAALAKSRSPWKTAHSPAAVEALGAACGREIEQPSYSADSVAAADQPAASDITDTLEAQRRVERAAIEAVTAEYRRLGWTVRSVEKDNCGYDLRCSRGREVACIEVKGRAKEGDRVILSSNEWDHRTDKGWRLAIVSGATSSHPVIEEFPGKALTTRFEVDPVAYRLTRRV